MLRLDDTVDVFLSATNGAQVGRHFQDLGAPYSDHLCVAGGDVFDHPFASPAVTQPPTIAPIATPTAPPTASLISAPTIVPIPRPTVVLSPVPTIHAPSSAPMPSPTRTPVLSASVGLTGVPGGCGGYTKTEELLLNLVLSSHIQGNASFSNHTCEDEDERRMLSNPAVALIRHLGVSTNPVMLAIEISVTTASVTDDDSTSAAQAVGSLLSAAQSSGALASTIMSTAAAANVSSLSSVRAQSASGCKSCQ